MTRFLNSILIAGLTSLAASGPAFSQAPATPPASVEAPIPQSTVPAPTLAPRVQQQLEIKESHLQAARELLAAARTLDAFNGLLPNIMQQVGLTLTNQNLTIQADQRKRTTLIESLKAVEEGFAPDREKLYVQIALIYAARFSEQEMRKIVEFLNSPEGQKFATISPLVAQDSFRTANAWADRIGQEAFEKVRAEMRKRGQPLQ